MKMRIQKWGNSLAVRIPKTLAKESNLQANMEVELSSRNGTVVIRPVRKSYSLKELLDGITKENLHGETSTGPAMGREIW